jgi:hypothetical protein
MPFHLVEIPENEVADDAVKELMGQFEVASRQCGARNYGNVYRDHQAGMRQFIFSPKASNIAIPRVKGFKFIPINEPDVSKLTKIQV